MTPTSTRILDSIVRQRVIGIVRTPTADAATEALHRLAAGGIEVAEVSLTTPEALSVIARARGAGDLHIGVGTVLDAAAVRLAVEAGAQFIVTPTVSAAVIAAGNRYGLPVIAGAATPTEMMAALEHGAALVKLFPASAFGPQATRDLLAALPQVALVPTGGVTSDTAPEYIAAGAVAVGMGSALTRGDDSARTTRDLLARLASSR